MLELHMRVKLVLEVTPLGVMLVGRLLFHVHIREGDDGPLRIVPVYVEEEYTN